MHVGNNGLEKTGSRCRDDGFGQVNMGADYDRRGADDNQRNVKSHKPDGGNHRITAANRTSTTAFVALTRTMRTAKAEIVSKSLIFIWLALKSGGFAI